jgi:hypothetical protein
MVNTMDNEILLTTLFLGTGLLAYVIIPGLLVVWDRVLDHMENPGKEKEEKIIVLDTSGTGEKK